MLTAAQKTFPSNGLSGNRRGPVGPKRDRRTRWHEVSDATRNAPEKPPRRNNVRVCDATGDSYQRAHTIDFARHAGSISPSRPRQWRNIPLAPWKVMPYHGLTPSRGCHRRVLPLPRCKCGTDGDEATMERHDAPSTIAALTAAAAVQTGAAGQHLLFEWDQVVLRRLHSVWRQLEVHEAMAY
jgi:hypothetical protein